MRRATQPGGVRVTTVTARIPRRSRQMPARWAWRCPEIATPRSNRSLIPKHQRRLRGFNELVISLVARGMTTRDTRAHLQEIYGVEVSAELISKVTDAIVPELRAWQQRPLDAVYPILYLDAIVVKVRTDHVVVNRPVYIAMAVDVDGRKHVLGLWLGKGDEGAKFWLGVITELKNRGVTDVLVVCCDGLTGFADAIEAVWPNTTVQTCVVHLIRNSIRFCSWKDRKAVTRALKPIYRAATIEAAALASTTSKPNGADNIRRSLICGDATGNASVRSWPSTPPSAKSFTRPTP